MLQQMVHLSVLPLTIVKRIHSLQLNRLNNDNVTNSDIHYSGEILKTFKRKNMNKGGNNNNNNNNYYNNSSNDCNSSSSSISSTCRGTER